jgi:proline iminopeptidase
MRWRKRVATIGLSIAGVAVGLLVVYSAFAYHAYKRVRPALRGCIDCATPVLVNGYQLYYRAVGEDAGSPPVVLVHGGPGHSSLSFKNAFDFLAEHTRVVYYDQRGSGNSQSKPADADYTVDELVDELEALRRDVIRADRIDVIGHSFGGAVAQRYALRHPEHVDRLVLIGSVLINNGMSSRFVWQWFGPALYTTALGWPPADPDAADAWFTRSANADTADRLFDKTQSRLLDGTGTLSFAPWRDISLSAVGADYKTQLARLDVPTMFIYGAADSPYTGKPVADEICSIVPHCTVVGFDRSGHWPFLEEPEKFQQVLRAFLQH